MKTTLKIKDIFGYVANDNPKRAAKDGQIYDPVIPRPKWTEQVVKRNADVGQTVKEMKKLIAHSHWQLARLAPLLKGISTYETCQNIWDFLFEHTRYKEDDKGKEQLREPSVSWAQRRTRGIDCDDFSIFASCILCRLGIPHYIRIARYAGKDYFQHVYIVVPQSAESYITIDPVLDEFDTEKTPIETKDFKVMEANNFSGIDISVLSGTEGSPDISGILLGVDFEEIFRIEGLGQIPNEQQDLAALHNHLVRTREAVASNPELIKEVDDPQVFLKMLDYAITYWHTDKRQEALDILAANEDKFNSLNGLEDLPEDYEEATIFYGATQFGSIDALGKINFKKGFFKKVGEAAKKVGTGIKTAAQAVVKYNPVSTAARGGLLLALKSNLFKISSKLKWGYATEAQAKQHGLNLEEWKKVREVLKQAENLFVKILKGNPANFKDAILKGKAGGLSGIGLGIEPVTATATASATPFLVKIGTLLKKVSFKKLFEKVKDARMRSEGGNLDAEGNQAPEYDFSEEDTPQGNKKMMQKTAEGGGENEPEEGAFSKVLTWVKDNKVATGLIAGGLAFLLIPSLRKSIGLSGASSRGRRKKGKRKTNPPKALPKGGNGKKIIKL